MDKENAIYAYNGILLNFKNKKILSHVTTWVNLEDIVSEINQSQKNKHRIVLLIRGVLPL